LIYNICFKLGKIVNKSLVYSDNSLSSSIAKTFEHPWVLRYLL